MRISDKQKFLSIFFIVAFLCFALNLSSYFNGVPKDSSTYIVLERVRQYLRSSREDLSYEVKNYSFIHLFQQIVMSSDFDEKRNSEILQTIQSNINHYSVKRVYIIEETWQGLPKNVLTDPFNKVVLLPTGKQPYYKDVFNTVSHYLVPRMKTGDMWMVANADIVLGNGFELLLDFMGSNEIIALSRHNKTCQEDNQCLSFFGSFDSFLGFGELKSEITERMNFRHSSFGSENIVIQEFQKGGYYLRNICKSIITYQIHCSDELWQKGHNEWIKANGNDVGPSPTHWGFP